MKASDQQGWCPQQQAEELRKVEMKVQEQYADVLVPVLVAEV